MNIIFGISNFEDFFYTVNLGKTNSDTFFSFLLKLIAKLNLLDRNWQNTTVLMLDNAPYHRSKINLERY